jgi:hypothetical protein
MFEIVLLEASEMEVDNETAHGPLLIVLLGMCLSGPDEGGLGQTSPGLLEPEQVGRSPPMVQGCPTRGDATTTMHSNVVELESQGPSDGLSSAVDSLAVGMPAVASAATMQNELEALVCLPLQTPLIERPRLRRSRTPVSIHSLHRYQATGGEHHQAGHQAGPELAIEEAWHCHRGGRCRLGGRKQVHGRLPSHVGKEAASFADPSERT